jgi:hypothetical protein
MPDLADTSPSTPKVKRNALIPFSFILACPPVLAIPVTLVFPSTFLYLIFVLPLGLVAALLARIALHQVKRPPGTPRERTLAIVAYFLGFSPSLYFCGQLTYKLLAPK